MSFDLENSDEKRYLNCNLGIHLFYLSITILLYVSLIFLSSHTTIHEDGYIIFRYAKNIGEGYGFVWNKGEDWIWGSTSLTWTLILALFAFFSIPLTIISQILSIFLGLLLICLNYVVCIKIIKIKKEMAFLGTLLIAVGQISVHVFLGFETVLITLLIYANFVLTLLRYKKVRWRRNYQERAFLLNAFLLSFTRPDGLVVAFVTYLIIFFLLEKEEYVFHLNYFILYLIATGIFLGILSVIFGQPLPNPFYIKKGGELIYSSSIMNAWNYYGKSYVGYLLLFFVIYLIIGSSKEIWEIFWLSFPYFVFIIAYFFINQTQNVAGRFQYPIVPVIIILSVLALDELLDGTKFNLKKVNFKEIQNNFQWFIMCILIVGLVLLTFLTTVSISPIIDSEDKIVVGKFLNEYHEEEYTIILTEAGMLPYYSEWYILDAWGLNNEYIAHHGLSLEYIHQFKPEIVQFHVYYSNFTDEWNSSTLPWDKMTKILYTYALQQNYTLACIIESWMETSFIIKPNGYQWYFLKPEFQDYQNILTGINALPVDYFYRGV